MTSSDVTARPSRAARRATGLAPLLLALALAAPAALPSPAAAQPLTERTPHLGGAWVSSPQNLHFQFSHRFRVLGDSADVTDIFSSAVVQNFPTFDFSYGLFRGAMVGFDYSTNSRVSGGSNEWEPYVKVAPVRGLTDAELSVALKGVYNGASKSADGELTAELRPGPLVLLGAVRGFSDGFEGVRGAEDGGEEGLALAGGANLRINRYLSLAGDVSEVVAGPNGDLAWSAGLHVGIPYTPHTFSIEASNVYSGSLQGVSVGDSDVVFWGFEFTVPFSGFARWGRIVSPEEAREEAAARPGGEREELPVRPGDRVVEVEITDFSFDRNTLRVPPGTVVRWINEDPVAHTSTADDGRWDSNLVGPGETYSRRFDEPGEFAYHCTPHPFMTGTVIVSEPGS